MAKKCVACDDCTKLCETFHHGQKDRSCIVTRFVSFIFGKNDSKALYLSPKFARDVNLASQETQIEDSSGKRWPVTVSYVNGLLAFKKGWNKFYVDHGLGEGQTLVFNYIKGSHFVVQIYQRSGCEILNFNNVSPRRSKRHRRDSGTVSQDDPGFQTPDVNPRKKHRLSPVVAPGSGIQNRQTSLVVGNADLARQICPLSVTMDDPSWMINRDDGYDKGEDRNFLYDLSSFEKGKQTPDTNKIEKALDTMISPSHTEYANKFEIAAPCHTGIAEQTKTSEDDDTQMAVIHENPIDGPSGDVFTDKSEEALDARITPSHELSKSYEDNTKTDVIHTNQINGNSGDAFSDKFDKMCTNIASSSRTEIMERTETMENDTEMRGILPNQITGHSGDVLTDKFHAKSSDNSILNKRISNDVSNVHNGERTCKDLLGNKHVKASDSQSPFVGGSKISEGAYTVKAWSFGSMVSGSVPNNPYSHRAIKKELKEEANAFPNISYGKYPTIGTNYDQMFSPVVKVEPDLPDEVFSSVDLCPFSAEVKKLPYLELHIPPIPGRRNKGRNKVVYLRGSNRRLWPVIYPDEYSVKALTDNWTLFCEQNNIKLGDECRFQPEEDKHLRYIYRVDVTHRFRQLLGN